MNPRQYANTVASLVIRWTALVLAGPVCAIGCEPTTRRTPDDTVVVVIDSPMMTADPRAVLSSHDGKLTRLVAAGLTAVDTDSMEPRLDLASRIEAVDPLTIDVTVRDDARFSDGSPVTAADVAGTYMNVLSPDSISASHKMLSDRFSRVEAVSRQVARFHLKAPLATFTSDIDYGIISFHGGTPPIGQALGAGPYQLRELTSTAAYLEPNPFYFGDQPKMPNVEIKFVRDSAARLLMLVGGSADLIQNAVRLDLVSMVRERPRVRFESSDGSILTYLMMNNEDPVLARREVRQAIALAIDRPAIIAAKLPGLATRATGLLPPQHWAYHGNVERWDHDLERARRLLDGAGLRDPDGDGPAPRLSLVYKTSSDAFRVALARVIAAQLAEVGIAVEVRSFEFGTFYADVKQGAYQLASMQTAEITEPDFYFMYFHSSWIPTPSNPNGFNRWRYRNATVDERTKQGREELDRDERIKIYSEVQKIVAEDVPIVPLWHEKNVVLTNVDVQGYRMTPNARLTGLRDVTKRR
jgi:peptide/nickel transport system substrate-binding protein